MDGERASGESDVRGRGFAVERAEADGEDVRPEAARFGGTFWSFAVPVAGGEAGVLETMPPTIKVRVAVEVWAGGTCSEAVRRLRRSGCALRAAEVVAERDSAIESGDIEFALVLANRVAMGVGSTVGAFLEEAAGGSGGRGVDLDLDGFGDDAARLCLESLAAVSEAARGGASGLGDDRASVDLDDCGLDVARRDGGESATKE